MSPEVPFFQDRRKRAGLVRRIGNLAAKIKSGTDNELIAMHTELDRYGIPPGEAQHLRRVMACHLEFVAALSGPEASLIAKKTGVTIELANLRGLKSDLSDAPEVMAAAFTDASAIAGKAMET